MGSRSDNEIDGLQEAIQRLPALHQSCAHREVIRSLLEDGYAEVFGPFPIIYRDPTGRGHKRAKLLIFMAESFIFDLFYVPVDERDHVPVIGRVYYYVDNADFIHLN
jgi:hypothetical protein